MAASLLMMTAALLVIVPLFIKRRRVAVDSALLKEVNIAQYQEQKCELENHSQQGLLTEAMAEEMVVELEKKLLSDVSSSTGEQHQNYDQQSGFPMAFVLTLLIPLLAIPLYWHLGAQTELSVAEVMGDPQTDVSTLLSTLEAWREKQPGNTQALYLLGGRYLALGRMNEAVDAYQRFYKLTDSGQGAAQLAQALYLGNNNQFDERVSRLVHESLIRNEFNTTALGMQGIAAFEQQDYSGALSAWDKALSVETDPAAKQSLMTGMNQARMMLGEAVPGIRVFVDLSPELKSLPGDTRVMVFARAQGSRMPIAVEPVLVADLPKEVLLDDSDAMMLGGDKLSNAKQLDISASISLNGDVTQADYKAEVNAVNPESGEVIQLMIGPAG